jgi:glutathione S-transferase
MLKLYEAAISPYVQKVKMALFEKGLEFETETLDLLAQEQLEADYLKLNPFHRVPVLVDGSAVLFESTAIGEYLEEKYPYPPLLPHDLVLRAEARAWEDVSDTYFGATLGALVQENFRKAGGPDPVIVAQHQELAGQYLAALDAKLEGRDFVAALFSLADIALAIQVSFFAQLGVDLSSRKNVARWLAAIQARPSFQKAQPTAEVVNEFIARSQAQRGQ